jgi:RNA polymerase sigma factor (sigma-70 family)
MSPPPAEQFAARIFMGPALRAQPDRRLVDLVRDGYDAAFEEIVRRYRRQLDRFAAAIVGGRCEDVTQDAFSKALPALRGSEAEIELRPWLYRIVRNTALNDLRDRPPAGVELTERLPGARSAAAEAEAREDLRELMDRLRALPEPQRAALVMRELEGLSHEEIAAALGVSGGAARQTIFRARAALREGLGLLFPLPLLRALSEHGGEVAAGGLGAGALKVGVATVLVAGTVGAGVAIEHHRDRPGPESADAAPLVSAKHSASGATHPAAAEGSSGSAARSSGVDGKNADRSRRGGNGPSENHGSLDRGLRDGSSGGPGPSRGGSHSDSGSGQSREDSHRSGSDGPGSGDDSSGSGSGDRNGSRSGSDGGGSGSSGSSGEDGGGTGEDSGSSGGSGDDGGLLSGGDGGSGSGSGESEPQQTAEPALTESGDGGDGGGDSGPGSGDESLSGTSATSGSGGSGGGS